MTGFILLGGALFVVFSWYMARNKSTVKQINWSNIYDADTPSFSGAPLDVRLIVLTPEVLAQAPDADVFTSPLGSEQGAFTYDAQPFAEENPKRGGKHYGQDWNGIGGMNTDLGDPVYAAARGKVVYRGEPSPEWGNVLVLLHRLPDGRLIQTLYAHLDSIKPGYGDIVGRGQIIGEVGTANGHYPAHLHFEMIESIANEAGMAAYGRDTANRIDPRTILGAAPPSAALPRPDPVPALRGVQLRGDSGRMHIRSIPDSEQKGEK